jgi:CRP-like cAMP-binding protein
MSDCQSHDEKGKAIRRSLGDIELLKPLEGEAIQALEGQCKWRRYRAGERLFARGSLGQEVFFIVDGEVEILGTTDSGREVALAKARAGSSVGEMAAIDGQARSASVAAVVDTVVAVLDAAPFIELLKAQGSISFELLQRLSSMVRKGDERVLELSILEAKQRTCAELLRLAVQDTETPDLWVIRPLPPLRAIAGSAGTTREIVANTLSQLYPQNIATRKGDSLFILDRQALEKFASAAL